MIDAELHRFCEDDNAFFFKVSDYTDAVVGDLGFFKVRMAPTIIALVEMYSHEFENAIADVRFQGTLAGFYSTSQKKLYMYEGVKYHFQRPYINGNRPEFPFGFEPVPTQDMGQRLCNALTEHFLPRMKPLDVDVTDEDKIRFAFDDYFAPQNAKVAILGIDLLCTGGSKAIQRQYENNGAIALYLDQPQLWLEKAMKEVLADEDMCSALTNALQARADIHAVCEAVRQMPDHPWNVRMRICEAVAGKNTVTVHACKDGKEVSFKANTSNLGKPKGIIYSFDIDPKDREKIEKIFKRKATGFHIEDIRQIEYRKKVIFQG